MTIVEATMTGSLGPMYPQGWTWMTVPSRAPGPTLSTRLREKLRLWRWSRGLSHSS